MTWRPLLDGSLATAARYRIAEIHGASCDAARRAEPIAGSGLRGIASLTLWFRVFGAHGGPHDECRYLGASTHAVALEQCRGGRAVGLFEGLAGLGWLEAFEQRTAAEKGFADLLDRMSARPWQGPFDLVYGITGLGVVALEHAAGVRRDAWLRWIADALIRAPGVVGGPLDDRTDAPATAREPVHLGVAHGVAGVLCLMAALHRRGVAGLEGPLDATSAALLRHARPDRSHGSYPECAGDEVPARTAWCHGDAGIAAALLAVARARADPSLGSTALALARVIATREPDDCGVDDASVCHGAAGVAHVLNCIWQATQDPEVQRGARRWHEYTLVRGTHGHDFLDGGTGVGQVLLAAVSPTPAAFDRLLLLSEVYR